MIARPDGKANALFNWHLVGVGLGELLRQLTCKSRWYGSTLVILDRGEPTSTKCSKCGERNPSSMPSDKRFHCAHCGHDTSRCDNAVRNNREAARRKLTVSVAPGAGETQNASRGRDKPHPGDRKGSSPTTETLPPLTGQWVEDPRGHPSRATGRPSPPNTQNRTRTPPPHTELAEPHRTPKPQVDKGYYPHTQGWAPSGSRHTAARPRNTAHTEGWAQ
ncbi:zinc ribbon domain-containing protein [Streptomyces syringium]|uniref:zinc ribbon domain-containing protein n=1 Tax=Streptomyces syringium TaxID=76729 RepID=UPI0033F1E0AA